MWDGTQIRSEKGRLHNEKGSPGCGRVKVARPGWGFLNDGLGWVERPSSGFLGSFSFSLTVTDRQTDGQRQTWVRKDWSCACAGTRPYYYCTQTTLAAVVNMCTPADTADKVGRFDPVPFVIGDHCPFRLGQGVGGRWGARGFWGGASAAHTCTVRGSQSIRWES